MRLVEVEIENFKQYAGTHTFRPGEKAMVAIVGQNGAGKTTLFEAIEWCLYNPARIRNDTLTPRVQGGRPRVRVVLEDPHSGIVYEIERLLKGGSTQAEIYRQDQPESPLVQGTRQVTEYVARELTGLSHTAFVSTFFTRQKELSFFGDLGATQRREQVGRLLGLETIRVAQKRIGEQRTRRQAEARVKREQYEEQTRGVDFAFERERLDGLIAEQASRWEAACEDERAGKLATAAASVARDLAQQRFAANAELLQTLERIGGEQRRYQESLAAAERDLVVISEAEQEIGRQRVAASNEPSAREALERHEIEKQKLETSNRLSAELRQLPGERGKIAAYLPAPAGAVSANDLATLAGATSLVANFDLVISALTAVDLEGLRHRLNSARALLELEESRARETSKLEGMVKLAADLQGQAEELTKAGLPADRLKIVQSERVALQQDATAAASVAEQTELRAKPLRSLEASLRASEFGEFCPTCARPFQAGEAVQTMEALGEQIRLMTEQIGAERARARTLNEQATQLLILETRLEKEGDEYLHLTGRLENGRGKIVTQRDVLESIERNLLEQLDRANLQVTPTRAEVEELDSALQKAETDCSRLPRLEVGREQLRASIEQQETLESEIVALGPIAYDPEAHNRDYATWSVARDAVARIEELSKQVALRPDREQTVSVAAERLTALSGERTRISQDQAELAFDPIELEQANRQMAEALERERSATDAAHLAERQLANARRDRQELDQLETRLKALSDESNAAEIAAIELNRIYNEFARFEKFVAVAVTPVLSDIASELLEKATDGKYDRIEFTEDYGIEVYDGEDDRFPLSQYSGGERDVIALCARLALSQVIGGQAATPIEFMVLDEVFGSLDLDRRRNLMEMLQRLMEENRAFQQLFVISHVDDVRAASMFDEVWRVSETAEGVSQLEQVSVTGALEDY